jgi:hypothetical protein
MESHMDRRGFAMPAAIGALVIMAALVSAGFYMARQELRIGVASNFANMAVNVAQAGANEVMANWNGYQLGNVALWGDTTITDTTDVGIWSVNITNTNNVIYYLNATGEITRGDAWGGATRNIGIVTRLIYADINPPAALTTRGAVSVKGTAEIIGTDEEPAAWAGYCGGTADMAGVMTNDTSLVTTTAGGTIGGDPVKEQDSTIVDETFTQFGDLDWDQLTALAQLEGKNVTSLGTNINSTQPALNGGGACDETVMTNWGDTLPSAPCGSYFPLIYHGGPTLRIQSGGIGQGILLVDGDLDLRGGFQFHGIIIVQGTFETQGAGERIVGAVMASNATLDPMAYAGGSEIQYSSCAVRRSILNNASLSRARPLDRRSWIDLSSVLN